MNTGSFANEKGLLVGCDEELEWLLPWWWEHYSRHNHYPAAFIDFGMSPLGITWCQEHGRLIPFVRPFDFIAPKAHIPLATQKLWEALFLTQNFWELRVKWFKKPFAMLQTPFQQTIWLDLDCEVKADLGGLFEACANPAGLAIAPEPDFSIQHYIQSGLLEPGKKTYNGGVVVYRSNSEALINWAGAIETDNAKFAGDSDLFAHVLETQGLQITELPQIYNWRMAQGTNPEAVIIHWVADWGKAHIAKEMRTLWL